MKTKLQPLVVALALIALAALNSPFGATFAQGTAFTYQGRLNSGTNSVTGSYDLTFALYNASSGGAQIGLSLTNFATGVTNGLFTTTVDFGDVFTNGALWLAIGVRTNGPGTFASLSPLQELTPTPYAVSAENFVGIVPLAQLPGAVSLLSDPGYDNFFAGMGAGSASLTGEYDVGVGQGALTYNNAGSFNTADGVYALQYVTNGNFNSGFGAYALQWDTSGSYNTASGVYALSSQPSYVVGSYNTADGANTLWSLSTGSNNVAIGAQAMHNASTGFENVAVGYGALESATIDDCVVAIGFEALQNDVGSGGFLTTGSGNTAIGCQAMVATTTGSANTSVGYLSLYENITGYQNTAIGLWSMLSNTNGYNNTAEGTFALGANTSGYQNTANGVFAMDANSTGYNNTATGYGALENLTTAANNTAMGANAMAGGSGSGGGNTACGSSALTSLTSGYNNVALGLNSLFTNTTGVDNVAVGVSTYYANAAGSQNTVVGTYGFQNLTSGSGNVGLGYYAGNSLTSGSDNVYIANAGGSSENNVMRIGSSQTVTYIAGVIQAPSVTSITITGGSDLAEPFSISTADQPVSEGDVVVIDEANPGQLKLTDQPYDTRVAGVVSGANGIHPGIQMHQQGLLDGGRNVALTGRVYVQADTSNGAIKPGDLLTTSGTPGRAMRVSDHARAQGAILGKAMTSLNSDHGMVLVLVTLQ